LSFIRPKIANYPTENRRFSAKRRLILSAVVAISLASVVSGCGGKRRRDMQSGSEELFERGTKSMRGGNYRNAIGYFENLEARYPFSNQAKQAQINLIYCYYRNGEPEAATDASIQFERENPTHPRVDYALYMRGLANFRGEKSSTQRLLRMNLAKRPPVQARESFSAFSRLIQRYPNSIYAADSRQRMIFLRNRLAEHENYVANYYFKRGAFVAASNRAKYTVETYDGAPAISEALVIMVLSYEKLGMSDLAQSTREVLELNYPDTKVPKNRKNRRFTFF
jgi:outer membrane protein assembly factor BamD